MIKMENAIELRAIINPDEEEIYPFVQKVKEFLITDSKSTILRFILSRVSKIPFEEFINIVKHSSDTPNKNKSSEKIAS